MEQVIIWISNLEFCTNSFIYIRNWIILGYIFYIINFLKLYYWCYQATSLDLNISDGNIQPFCINYANQIVYHIDFFFNYLKLIVVLLLWYTINFDNKIIIYARSTLYHVSGSKFGLSKKKKVAARLSIKGAIKKFKKK